MNKLAIIFIVFLVGTSIATSEEEVQTTIQKMENNKYGKTLLATIALQLEVEGPVEDLIHMLQQNQDDLQNLQTEEDAAIWALTDQCDADIAALVVEIEAAQKRIDELTKELGEKIPIRDQKITEKERKQAFRKLINEKVAELDENKKLKDAEWAEEQQQHDAAQYTIEKAKQILVDALKADSFLQKRGSQATAFAEVSAHLTKHAKQTYKRKSWNSLFNVLAQIMNSAPVQSDQSSVDRVINLCDQLLAKIMESREIERKDYEHWVSEYQNTRDQLTAKAGELTAEINQLETEIDTLTKRINNCKAEKADQETRRDQKQAEHDERLAYCDQELVNYSERRQARQDQIEILSDAIALLTSHLRLFREYANERFSVGKAE